jgi:UPF0716 protein FxsA
LADLLNGLAVIVFVLLLLALVPVIELALLIRLYRATNLLTTLGLVIGAGLLGAALARRQGFEIWRRIQSQLAQGQTPTRDVLDGLLVLVAGFLLILPGLLSDIAGFLMLLPPVRGLLRPWLARRLIPPGAARFYGFPSAGFPETARRDNNEIEAEYTVEPGEPSSDPRLPKSTD